jgi:hypothetical protein
VPATTTSAGSSASGERRDTAQRILDVAEQLVRCADLTPSATPTSPPNWPEQSPALLGKPRELVEEREQAAREWRLAHVKRALAGTVAS